MGWSFEWNLSLNRAGSKDLVPAADIVLVSVHYLLMACCLQWHWPKLWRNCCIIWLAGSPPSKLSQCHCTIATADRFGLGFAAVNKKSLPHKAISLQHVVGAWLVLIITAVWYFIDFT